MPKSHLLLAALIPGVLLSVIAVGLFLTQRKSLPDLSNIISQNANTATLTTSSGMTVALFKESGDVKYRLPDREFVVLAGDEMNLPNGSSVKTGKGLAHVIFPDNSVMSISEDSEVMITFSQDTTSISQLIGKTFHRVTSLISGKTYEVETPTTLATVRGTVFGVDVAQNQVSAVYVTESVVEVGQMEKKDGQRIIKNTVKVEKDKEVVVPPAKVSSKMEVKPMNNALKNDSWVKRNEMISEEVKKQESLPQKKPVMETLKEMKEKPEMKTLDSEASKVLLNTSVSTYDTLYDTTLFTEVKVNIEGSPTPTPATIKTLDTSTSNFETTIKTYPSPSPTPIFTKTEVKIYPTPTPTASPKLDIKSDFQIKEPLITAPTPTPSSIFFPLYKSNKIDKNIDEKDLD